MTQLNRGGASCAARMYYKWGVVAVVAFATHLTAAGAADPNPAMNAPDATNWSLFAEVAKSAGGGNATFETWASDTDTFNANPKFPGHAAPIRLHAPIVPALGLAELQRSGLLIPAVPPNPSVGEEARRNQAAFDFIVQNRLYSTSGLKAAFGKALSFPIEAIEVKANWFPVEDIPAFSLNRVTLADVPKVYHVNTGADGKQYALVSFHIISKRVPNWTWATFEHRLNPARCDILGCRDSFGANTVEVTPNAQPGKGYGDCTHTAPLIALLKASGVDASFLNYCLKGSQTDFTDNTGLDTRLGNSVTEDTFVNRSSCLTCHGRAAFSAQGVATSSGGFDAQGAPLGPINPNWYWSTSVSPPLFVGEAGLTRIATSSDFVWSVPFCAIDDTVSPPRPSRCTGK